MTYLLILYFVFLLGFMAYSAAGIYHLWRFGYAGDLTRPIIIIYSFLATFIIIVSLIAILTRDWSIAVNF